MQRKVSREEIREAPSQTLGVKPTCRKVMIMVYALILMCAVFARIFLYYFTVEKHVEAVVLKGMASLCFVLIGALCSPGTNIAKRIMCGLVIGFIADILLDLRMVFTEKGELIFLIGMLVFLLGHIMYLIAVLPMSYSRVACFTIGIILAGVLVTWILQRTTVEPTIMIFGVIYLGTVVVLSSFAVGNFISNHSTFTAMFAVGTVLFLISDILLTLNVFGEEFRMSFRYGNVGLYYMGQVLIALSLKFLP